MPDTEFINIEVAFARPDRQLVLPLKVPVGTTILQAIDISGILQQFPEIDVNNAVAGIFGKKMAADHVVIDGDRVEIYRPLTADPREVRRKLAEQGKTMGKARGAER